MSSTNEKSIPNENPSSSKDDTLSNWSEYWGNAFTPWHEKNVHRVIRQYGSYIIPDKKNIMNENDRVRIFVPLCGKSVDMAYFVSKDSVSEVVGIDGVAQALEEFANENPHLNIRPNKQHQTYNKPSFQTFTGHKIKLIQGDFFNLSLPPQSSKFDSIWDRGSLEAIHPQTRRDYVQIISRLIRPGGTILLMAFERREGIKDSLMKGPPFHLDESTVRILYEEDVGSVSKVAEYDLSEVDPDKFEEFRLAGVTCAFEVCYVIKARGGYGRARM